MWLFFHIAHWMCREVAISREMKHKGKETCGRNVTTEKYNKSMLRDSRRAGQPCWQGHQHAALAEDAPLPLPPLSALAQAQAPHSSRGAS